MAMQHVIDVDLARVHRSKTKEGFVRTLEWGDGVELIDVTDEYVEIRTVTHETQD